MSLLSLWRVSPRHGPIHQVDTLETDKPILIYSGGMRDWIERGSDEKLKDLLYNLITGESGAVADCDMYVLGVNTPPFLQYSG